MNFRYTIFYINSFVTSSEGELFKFVFIHAYINSFLNKHFSVKLGGSNIATQTSVDENDVGAFQQRKNTSIPCAFCHHIQVVHAVFE